MQTSERFLDGVASTIAQAIARPADTPGIHRSLLQGVKLHPYITIKVLTIGAEKAPLLVIDNVTDADALVDDGGVAAVHSDRAILPGHSRARTA